MHFSVTDLRNFTFQCLLYGLNNYIFPIGSSSSFSLAMIKQAVGILFIGHIPDRKMGIQGNMKARLVLAGKYDEHRYTHLSGVVNNKILFILYHHLALIYRKTNSALQWLTIDKFILYIYIYYFFRGKGG